MKKIIFDEQDVINITNFLKCKKFIYHPRISPDGIMDFTEYGSRNYVVLLDRNLLTKMIDFFRSGVLNDAYIRKVIGSIMFWAISNDIALNSGLALNEYARNNNDNIRASIENNTFKMAMDFYNPDIWLEIALNRRIKIDPILKIPNIKYKFDVESEHQNTHLSAMYHLASLYFDTSLKPVEKEIRFLEWYYENMLICQYMVIYSFMLFTEKSKIFNNFRVMDENKIIKICKNQSWDINYLSVWSTLYWDDSEDKTVFLFATMDKELKTIFKETHDIKTNQIGRFFSRKDALLIQNCIYKHSENREKPMMQDKLLKKLNESELKLLLEKIKNIS